MIVCVTMSGRTFGELEQRAAALAEPAGRRLASPELLGVALVPSA